MNSIFLRIYGGMLAALVLVALLACRIGITAASVRPAAAIQTQTGNRKL